MTDKSSTLANSHIEVGRNTAKTLDYYEKCASSEHLGQMRGLFSAVLASSGWSILSGELAVKQAAMFDSFMFDAVSFLQKGLAPAEVDVRWG